MEPVKVFYCYAREDEPLRQELAKHLVPLKRHGIIEDWCDQMISPGQPWEEEINQRLEAAQIILLLISADFVASEYCYTKEMKRALERHEAGEARVIPIIMRATAWKIAPFSKLQCLPSDARAVKAWQDRDAAFTDVAEGIYRAAAEIQEQAEKEERQRRAAEAEVRRKAEQAEAQRRAQEEARRQAEEAEARRKAEQAEAQRRAQEEARRQAEEAEARRKAEEAESRRRAKEAADQQANRKKAKSPATAIPDMLAIQNIHGWPADKVQALQRQTAQALNIAVIFRDKLMDGTAGPEMVVIPGGRFQMGSPPDEPNRGSNERQHEVEVKPFAIGKYAVTFEEYDYFAQATRRDKPSDSGWGRGRRPVINVSRHDAVAYAEWLSQQTGQAYRLPTEAEWEYACRAGTVTPFYFGSAISTDQANYDGTYGIGFVAKLLGHSKGVYRKMTVEVGRFLANAWGLHDMHGNVWEWTCSGYDENYGGAELRCVDKDAGGPRVLRGGSWTNEPGGLRAASRHRTVPVLQSTYGGFRLARNF